jgi:hypothetical protein
VGVVDDHIAEIIAEEEVKMANRPRKHRLRPLPLPPKPCNNPNECKDYQADMFKPGESGECGECAFCFNGYCLVDRKGTK